MNDVDSLQYCLEPPGLDPSDSSKARSQQLIKFRAYFYKSFSTLEQHRTTDVNYYSQGVDDLSRLQMPTDPRNAWRLGFRVVRGLLSGQLPRNVHQIISCVMIANAMREETEYYKFTREEYVSMVEAYQRLTKNSFSRDLCRWRDELIAVEEDRQLFERITSLLFDVQLGPRRPNPHHECLSHFQELFQNLLSDVDLDESELEWHQRTPLSDMQEHHAEAVQNSAEIESGSNTEFDPKTSAHRSEIYTGSWKAHDFRIIKLAATVIFCVVIAICLGESGSSLFLGQN
jgi:hypothetical protein